MGRLRGRRKRLYVFAAIAVVVVSGAAVALGIAVSHVRGDAERESTVSRTASVESSESLIESSGATSTVPVEVPSLVGMPVDEAELLLTAAGLVLKRVPTPPGESAPGTVLAQDPAAGERVPQGSPVELVYADPAAAAAPAAATYVVCIDPGHQAAANNGLEPVGPGASEQKAKVTGGAAGVVTRQPEHALVLTLSLKVKERLERYGITVVMTRTISAVDISNSQRATVANQVGADLFLRIHADSSTNADVRGVSTLYPGGNDWVKPIEAESLKAAGLVQREVLASTGANDRSVVMRADLAGFNYATVPAILVETGFLSNPVDDRNLADPAYQDHLADGIARGVLKYLGVAE